MMLQTSQSKKYACSTIFENIFQPGLTLFSSRDIIIIKINIKEQQIYLLVSP